jgi:hypothetical protein
MQLFLVNSGPDPSSVPVDVIRRAYAARNRVVEVKMIGLTMHSKFLVPITPKPARPHRAIPPNPLSINAAMRVDVRIQHVRLESQLRIWRQ